MLVAAALGVSALSGTAAAATSPDAQPVDDHSSSRTDSLVPANASGRAARPATAVLGAPVRVLATPTAASYTVVAGDTVGHIAARLGTTVDAIVAANGLDARAFILQGQVLSIPAADEAAAAPQPAAAPAPAPAGDGQYTVVAGDTVGGIAASHGSTVAAIVAANGLDASAFIREGQALSIPGAGGASAPTAPVAPVATAAGPAAASTSYTVVSGDTLSGIAAGAGTTTSALFDANPGIDGSGLIRTGQVISVPGTAATSDPLPNTFAGRTYPDATVQAATANRDVLAARAAPSREEMQQLVADTARTYGVDPALAQAISFQESGFDMRAVSPANAVGAMQVIPSSGEWASMLAGRPIDLLDARDNALAGVLILKAHTDTGADEATVIGAYYQGMTGVLRDGFYPDTRRYVANVQTLMTSYR